MKIWSISLIGCCLLTDAFVGQHLITKHRPAYTVTTNQTELTILWQNQPLVHGIASNIEVAVSPDGQSVAWVQLRYYEHPDCLDEGSEPRTAYGILWNAHNGNKPIEVQAPKTSRGENFEWHRESPFMTWYPHALRWDSTSRFLYFITPRCVTSGAFWQLKPGDSKPRFVDSGGDYGLVTQWWGPDNIVIEGLRYEAPDYIKNYDHWYLYTANDIAKPEFVQSEKRFR